MSIPDKKVEAEVWYVREELYLSLETERDQLQSQLAVTKEFWESAVKSAKSFRDERDKLRAELAVAKELVRWRVDRKEPIPNHRLGYWIANKEADFLVIETATDVYWLPFPPMDV